MVALMKPDNRILDTIIQGDCLDVLKRLDTCSVDACVVDPPYGLGEVKDIAGLLQAWIRDEDDSRFIGKSGFMGKEWDAGVPGPRYWREVLRVMKPGAHILCFSSTRTVDLMMIALRLAGFQIRDQIDYIYGSGFPKNTDISKKIDKMRGAKREVIGSYDSRSVYDGKNRESDKTNGGGIGYGSLVHEKNAPITAPATPEARQHAGTGTALKPAHEPIILARKPLSESSIAANVLKWGTGGLAIDACRVSTQDNLNGGAYSGDKRRRTEYTSTDHDGSIPLSRLNRGIGEYQQPQGRFPSNLLLSHSLFCTPLGTRKVKANGPSPKPEQKAPDIYNLGLSLNSPVSYRGEDGLEEVQAFECHPSCPILQLDIQSGVRKSGGMAGKRYEWKEDHGASAPFAREGDLSGRCFADQGGASRYFSQFSPTPDDYAPYIYCSKASRAERNRGCEGLPEVERHTQGRDEVHWIDRHDGKGKVPVNARIQPAANHHPTVKPVSLMKWLVRLVCPEGGIVLDPFFGSGSTGVACVQEGYHFIGIEESVEYIEIARARVAHAYGEVCP